MYFKPLIRIFLLGTLFLQYYRGFCLPDEAKHGIFVEGYVVKTDFNDRWFSLNYEYSFGKSKRNNFRIGLYPDFNTVMCFPVTYTRLSNPEGINHFEYGIGFMSLIEVWDDPSIPGKQWYHDFVALMIPLMYRWQDGNGFFFRLGINLLISDPTAPSPSFSIGYRF